MQVTITGGHGFIGQHLIRSLCERGHQVLVLDLYSKPPSVQDLEYQHHTGDVLDLEWLQTVWPNDTDVVVHLVGMPDAGLAQQNPHRSFQLNVASLERVLNLCRGSPPKRIVVPSTAAIYGATREVPVKETSPPAPLTIYAWHKWMAELLVQAYAQNSLLRYTILRLFNVYGQGNKGIIDLALRKAAQGELLRVHGADQVRDFIYAADVTEAISRLIESELAYNNVLNLGSGQGLSIRQVITLLFQVIPTLQVRFDDSHGGSQYNSVADISLARELLNWSPHASREFMTEVIRKEMAHHD